MPIRPKKRGKVEVKEEQFVEPGTKTIQSSSPVAKKLKERNEKVVGWCVNADDYQTIKRISHRTDQLMKDIIQECIRDWIEKKRKEGIVDKNGNLL